MYNIRDTGDVVGLKIAWWITMLQDAVRHCSGYASKTYLQPGEGESIDIYEADIGIKQYLIVVTLASWQWFQRKIGGQRSISSTYTRSYIYVHDCEGSNKSRWTFGRL